MASMESLGLMLFTIEIMKERLTSSGFCRFTLAFTNCVRMPCIASRSVTPNASAMSCSPSSGSGWSMENPWDKSFIRGVTAAVVRSVAATAVVLLKPGAVFMSIFSLARAPTARAVRQRAGDHSLRRAGATSTVDKEFCGSSRRSARHQAGPYQAGPWASCGWRDDGVVPLICPTCQILSQPRRHHASDHLLLCMGLFSIFQLGALAASTLRLRSSQMVNLGNREDLKKMAKVRLLWGKAKRWVSKDEAIEVEIALAAQAPG